MNLKFQVIFIIFYFSVSTPSLVAALSVENEHLKTVTFLHFNDFYEISGRDNKGGLLALQQSIAQQKISHPNAIVTFGGDLLSPSFFSSQTKGQHMVDAMMLLGIDVAVPGNHEFDFGLKNAATRFQASRFPWVISNLSSVDKSLQNSTSVSYVHQVNGIKVGFMGLITPQLAFLSRAKASVKLSHVIDTARLMVTELNKENVDLIVALTHLTLEEDLQLLELVNGIDLILGGHDHYPVSMMLNNTLLLKSGLNGEYLGIVNVQIDKSEKQSSLLSWKIKSTAGNQAGSEETAVSDYLAHYNKQLAREKNKHIVDTLIPLDARTSVVRSTESGFGNLVADAMRMQYQTDIALINGGAIRSDKVYQAGTALTGNDILSALPFANRTAVIKISGKQLISLLEYGVSAVEKYSGRFPHVSGMSFRFSPEHSVGQRIRSVMINNQAVEVDKIYTLATVDFLIHGGDGYEQFSQAETIVDAEAGDLLTNVLSAYLMNLKQITSIETGRAEVLHNQIKVKD